MIAAQHGAEFFRHRKAFLRVLQGRRNHFGERLRSVFLERQYQAAEPENRLVQRTLERRWEEALQEVRRLEEEYARFRQTQPTTLASHEVERIRELARDLPTLWGAPTTTSADRQQVIRFLVERVEVEIEGVSDRARVTVTWAGGQQTRHVLLRPVGRYEQTADFDRVMARIRELRAVGRSYSATRRLLARWGVLRAPRATRPTISPAIGGHASARGFAPALCARFGTGR